MWYTCGMPQEGNMLNRRDFMTMGALALAGCQTIEMPQARNARPQVAPKATPAAKPAPPPKPPKPKAEFHVFSKMFQDPVCTSYDAVAELMAKAGFNGIEWTVRPKGHVLPENAKADLPKAVEAARKQGLKSTMLVTAITDGDDPASEALLKTAADNGFKPRSRSSPSARASTAPTRTTARGGRACSAASCGTSTR